VRLPRSAASCTGLLSNERTTSRRQIMAKEACYCPPEPRWLAVSFHQHFSRWSWNG
jgi:hypothetical protein